LTLLLPHLRVKDKEAQVALESLQEYASTKRNHKPSLACCEAVCEELKRLKRWENLGLENPEVGNQQPSQAGTSGRSNDYTMEPGTGSKGA
jgi:hypothetical protein